MDVGSNIAINSMAMYWLVLLLLVWLSFGYSQTVSEEISSDVSSSLAIDLYKDAVNLNEWTPTVANITAGTVDYYLFSIYDDDSEGS